MNKAYDYLGTVVSTSAPLPKLTTVKKVLYLDSADRDTNVYRTNGDFVLYLPRTYEKVTSLMIKSAEFPPFNTAFQRSITGSTGSTGGTNLYFFLGIEGLNKSDETALGADRSTFTDSVFAKFQVGDDITKPLFYTESSGQHIVQEYKPPISKLDRLHIYTRLHSQQGGIGTLCWSREFSLALEIETMENSFDDFSSLETRVQRS
jgi:hypothetical protein